jgi:hypothetical protein
LPVLKFSNKPLFNYISFFSQIPSDLISDMAYKLIEEVKDNEHKKEYKYYILKRAIYKFFINNCKGLNLLNWNTSQSLSEYQGASTCFSQLCILKINLRYAPSSALFEMAEICQNIIHLDILNCDNDNVAGVINLIDIQRNLQSLCIDYRTDGDEQIYKLVVPFRGFCQLSKMIEKKAAIIKNLL